MSPPSCTCSTSQNQGEVGFWHALTSTLTKHVHAWNTNYLCCCPYEHDICDVAVKLWHRDSDCMTLWQFLFFFSVRAGSVSDCLFGSFWLGVIVRAHSCCRSLRLCQFILHPLQVSWGLIVRIKYSWKHWIDKWRYKHTVKFSIGQVSLTSLDTIYCTTWHSL